ncbi:hypothetical protein F0562_022774 [Nyssa sinensis]|uniref:Rx N-terminal domain-containing protein n=1 Tax=Nyssa sinensis TaxID=561372 RepID=A0A5J5BIQ0_9ASTE|nr:hypothetical protein F0562_022774 [Nyssa sinensis]
MNTFTHLQSESRSITDSASSLTSISPSSINCRSPIMADALINLGVELAWIAERYIEQKVRLVVGVKKEIKKLESTLQTILAVLNDAEKRQIKEEPVRLWLEKVKDISYDADDLFAEWTTVILKRQIESTAVPKQKVCFYIFSCLCFNRGVDREVIHRHDIAHKIQAINERLDEIATEKDRYNFITNPAAGEDSERYKGTVSFVVVSQVRGRDQDLNNLVNKLLCEETNQADGSPHIISVVGMGGIGKTTLAQLAYNCAEIKAHFDITMWVCVSTPFDQIRIAKAIVEDVDDHKIEADNLIKLWMAQGYLSSGRPVIEEHVEIKGREYLENLVMRSFFQDIEKDKEGGNIVRFKMHDMVHDFAQFLTKKECFIVKVDSGIEPRLDSETIRHLTLIRAEEAPFPVPTDYTDKLHTFWVQSFYDCPPIVSERDIVPSDLFHRLTCLRALDLSRNRLDELPRETLKLVACDHLSKLPEGMGKLINLRHLEIERTERLKMLPKGIGGLSALRTLSKFFAGSSGDSVAAACKLGDLKNLNYLRGKLKIEGLGYVADAIEAEEAELKNKQHLLDLCLDFCPLVQVEGITGVFEALQLHPNLHYLQIKGYGGTKFPNWMLSLINLRKLQLQKCQNCERLPPLGRLPSLESLHIEEMDSLKSISLEFLGIGNCNDGGDNSEMTNDSTNSGTGASSSVVMAFPKLNKLKFVSMRGWEEWNVINTRREDIKIMPCLRCLKLSNCDKLEALPHCLLQMAPQVPEITTGIVHDCSGPATPSDQPFPELSVPLIYEFLCPPFLLEFLSFVCPCQYLYLQLHELKLQIYYAFLVQDSQFDYSNYVKMELPQTFPSKKDAYYYAFFWLQKSMNAITLPPQKPGKLQRCEIMIFSLISETLRLCCRRLLSDLQDTFFSPIQDSVVEYFSLPVTSLRRADLSSSISLFSLCRFFNTDHRQSGARENIHLSTIGAWENSKEASVEALLKKIELIWRLVHPTGNHHFAAVIKILTPQAIYLHHYALDLFGQMVGLKPNLNKRSICSAGSSEALKFDISDIMGIEEGSLCNKLIHFDVICWISAVYNSYE